MSIRKVLILLAIILALATRIVAQDATNDAAKAHDLKIEKVNIVSEGTRIVGHTYVNGSPTDTKLPTVIMAHGWGGVAATLDHTATEIAKAGYLVLTIDYRGWGESDARLILASGELQRQGDTITANVIEVREVVDPIEQTTDIMNAINWIQDHPQCDTKRIGLWGTSYSGGHVAYVAARDSRVKAFVSQVGAFDSRWTIATPESRAHTYSEATKRTHGTIGYPSAGAKFMNMAGQPIWEKLMQYAPIEDIHRIKNCAQLYLIAEKEELYDNRDHAILAHERAIGAKKLVVIPGIKHYGIYGEARPQAEREAIRWFDEHLKN